MDNSKHLFQPMKSKERMTLPKPVAVSTEEARIEGIFTVRQRSCEKVMSSQVWVSVVPCPSRGGGYLFHGWTSGVDTHRSDMGPQGGVGYSPFPFPLRNRTNRIRSEKLHRRFVPFKAKIQTPNKRWLIA